MGNPRRSICSGDIYFANNTQDVVTQAGYQDRLAKKESVPVWAGRPGVVVSDERETSSPGGGGRQSDSMTPEGEDLLYQPSWPCEKR